MDVKSAFLQGEEIERELFIKCPKEMKQKGKLMKLKKCINGLNDASLKWFRAAKKEIESYGCQQCSQDSALFYRHDDNGEIEGMICLHVDDLLHAGSPSFRKNVIDGIRKTFAVGSIESGTFKYIGFKFTQDENQIKISQ